MPAAEIGDDPPTRRPLQEAELEQIRLVDIFDRLCLLAEGDRERRQPDRAAAELLDHGAQELTVEALETGTVHLEQCERLLGDRGRDGAFVTDLGDVAHAPQDPVRDARRAARACGDELGRIAVDLDAEDVRRAADDRRQLLGLVQVEPEREPEAISERRGEQTGPRRRADERERRQVERERARRRPLADDDVEPEVLERGIQDLLGGAAHAVDLVDEEHVAFLERGEDRSDVLALEPGARDLPDADAELVADDLRERGLAEPGRAGEQHVVERLVTRTGGGERDRELLLHSLLADEVGEAARPERALELLFLVAEHRCEELIHAACFNAARTCSSSGSSGSTPASARSASTSDQPSSTRASRAVRSPPSSVTPARLIFSFSSSTTRCAVFRPTPGIAWKRFTSSRAIARASSAGVEPDTIASATLGPTPFTPSSSSKSSRSAVVAKPKSCSASSRTIVWISTTMSPSPRRWTDGVALTR